MRINTAFTVNVCACNNIVSSSADRRAPDTAVRVAADIFPLILVATPAQGWAWYRTSHPPRGLYTVTNSQGTKKILTAGR